MYTILFILALVSCEIHGKKHQIQDENTENAKLRSILHSPENMKILHIDALTFIQFDNKIERVMGLSDDKYAVTENLILLKDNFDFIILRIDVTMAFGILQQILIQITKLKLIFIPNAHMKITGNQTT